MPNELSEDKLIFDWNRYDKFRFRHINQDTVKLGKKPMSG